MSIKRKGGYEGKGQVRKEIKSKKGGGMDLLDISTFIGAVIGAAGSIIGGKWAAENSIKAQQRLHNEQKTKEEEKIKRKVMTSASIIEADLFTALGEAIRVSNGINLPHWGNTPSAISISADYSSHIANIEEYVTVQDLISLNRLYGLINIFQNSISINAPGFNDIRIHLLHIGYEVYGDQFNVIATQFNYDALDHQRMIDLMASRYDKLFSTIKQIQVQFFRI